MIVAQALLSSASDKVKSYFTLFFSQPLAMLICLEECFQIKIHFIHSDSTLTASSESCVVQVSRRTRLSGRGHRMLALRRNSAL